MDKIIVEAIGWIGSGLLIFSILQTQITRLRIANAVASVMLVAYNLILEVWPMVALNAAMTMINLFYLTRGALRETRRRQEVEADKARS